MQYHHVFSCKFHIDLRFGVDTANEKGFDILGHFLRNYATSQTESCSRSGFYLRKASSGQQTIYRRI